MARNRERNLAWQKEYRKKHPENRERNAEYSRIWRSKNKLRSREHTRNYRDKVRMEVFDYYSPEGIKCKQCGFDNIDALCLDHINNDGAKHRRETSGHKVGGINFYKYIRANGYPDNLQLLCANCNIIKEKIRLRKKSNAMPD